MLVGTVSGGGGGGGGGCGGVAVRGARRARRGSTAMVDGLEVSTARKVWMERVRVRILVKRM
jgi:hypothetical protein